MLSSSTDRAYLQGRTAAGGWSQQRFARRRENQRTASFESASDDHRPTARPAGCLAARTGAGRRPHALAEVLADPRLAALGICRVRVFGDIAEPRRAVLDEIAARSLSVEIVISPMPA